MYSREKIRFQDLLSRLEGLGDSRSFVSYTQLETANKRNWTKDYNDKYYPRWVKFETHQRIITVTLIKDETGSLRYPPGSTPNPRFSR